jgi:hypothetical protein
MFSLVTSWMMPNYCIQLRGHKVLKTLETNRSKVYFFPEPQKSLDSLEASGESCMDEAISEAQVDDFVAVEKPCIVNTSRSLFCAVWDAFKNAEIVSGNHGKDFFQAQHCLSLKRFPPSSVSRFEHGS